jgi:hypothetical protein
MGLLEAFAAVPDPEVEGRLHLTVPDEWSFFAPSGGALMSGALAALRGALPEPAHRLVSAQCIFSAPVLPGPAAVEVEVLRAGRSATQLSARLGPLAEGRPAPHLVCLATFGVERPGPSLRGGPPPAVPHWRECRPWPPRGRRFPFFERLEDRIALGHTLGERGWTPGPPRYARWLRYREPVVGRDGALDPLALPPIIDLMPPALIQALGPETPPFFAPSLDLSVHVLEETRREWLLVAGYGRWAGAGRASCEVEVWDEDGRLVAYGTQTMILRGLGAGQGG